MSKALIHTVHFVGLLSRIPISLLRAERKTVFTEDKREVRVQTKGIERVSTKGG